MALTGKYVDIKRILEGVYRDYGWTHEIDWVDVIEWVGEVLDLIAAPKQYVNKVTDNNTDLNHPCPITIKNYRGELPCDLLYIVQVRENKAKVPMRYSTDTFQRGLEKNEANIDPLNLSWYGTLSFSSPILARANLTKDTCNTDLTYMINDCYMFTNFEEGEVELSYMAFPTDEDGLPMVPDNVKYIQAVKAYIAEKVGQKMFIQGKMDGQRFNYLQRERDWYVGAATTAGHLPSIDEMESWKNQFVRLIPNLNLHRDSFRYQGDAHRQINHNSL